MPRDKVLLSKTAESIRRAADVGYACVRGKKCRNLNPSPLSSGDNQRSLPFASGRSARGHRTRRRSRSSANELDER